MRQSWLQHSPLLNENLEKDQHSKGDIDDNKSIDLSAPHGFIGNNKKYNTFIGICQKEAEKN